MHFTKAYRRKGTAPLSLTLITRFRLSDQLQTPADLLPGGSPWYPLQRRLGGPQSQSRGFGGEKISCHLPQLERNNDLQVNDEGPQHYWCDESYCDPISDKRAMSCGVSRHPAWYWWAYSLQNMHERLGVGYKKHKYCPSTLLQVINKGRIILIWHLSWQGMKLTQHSVITKNIIQRMEVTVI